MFKIKIEIKEAGSVPAQQVSSKSPSKFQFEDALGAKEYRPTFVPLPSKFKFEDVVGAKEYRPTNAPLPPKEYYVKEQSDAELDWSSGSESIGQQSYGGSSQSVSSTTSSCDALCEAKCKETPEDVECLEIHEWVFCIVLSVMAQVLANGSANVVSNMAMIVTTLIMDQPTCDGVPMESLMHAPQNRSHVIRAIFAILREETIRMHAPADESEKKFEAWMHDVNSAKMAEVIGSDVVCTAPPNPDEMTPKRVYKGVLAIICFIIGKIYPESNDAARQKMADTIMESICGRSEVRGDLSELLSHENRFTLVADVRRELGIVVDFAGEGSQLAMATLQIDV